MANSLERFSLSVGMILSSLKLINQEMCFASITVCIPSEEPLRPLGIPRNGEGLPNGILPKNPKSLGQRLVKLFTEQLNGKLEYITSGGANYVISF